MSDKKTGLFTKRATKSEDLSAYMFDKVQPQAIEVEKAVLGALMLDTDAVASVIDILRPQSFYVSIHQKIYECISDLYSRNQPIDLITVVEIMRKYGGLEEVGGPYYITQLTHRIGSAANVESHARIVAEKHILRELIKNSNEVIKKAYDDSTDVFELLDETEQSLFDITDQNVNRQFEKMGNLVHQAIEQIEKLRDQDLGGITGVPTGFSKLDGLTAGWQKSDLVIIAARPSMGKTAFTLSLARNAAVDHNIPVAFFSLEMSALQLVQRLISMEVELESDKLRKGNLKGHEWAQLNDRVTKIADAPIYIDDTPGINIFELRAKCRRLKMQYDIQMVVIDYLQLMSGTGDKRSGNREQEISAISRALKGVGKELNVPVIALSQLSRAVETRGGNKKPQLSDLRESGAIEQDADMVLFLYRPEYYGFDRDDEGNPTQGIAEVIIAKHRNGALDTVKTRFVGKFAKFIDYDVMQSVPDGFMSMSQAEEIATITMGSKLNNGGSSGVTTNVVPVDDGGDLPF